MSNQFKKLLHKIGQLAAVDQKWLLNQLTPEQKKQLATKHGETFLNVLQQNHRQAKVEIQKDESPLPSFCKALQEQPPLFIAIVLEQGQFPWQNAFLANLSQAQDIDMLLHNEVKQLKAATKSYLYENWQSQLCFSEQLEIANG